MTPRASRGAASKPENDQPWRLRPRTTNTAQRGVSLGGFGGEDVEELRQRLAFVEAAERGDEAFHRGEHGLALDRLALVGLTFEGGVTLGLRGFAFGLGRVTVGLGGIAFGLRGVAGGQFGFVARRSARRRPLRGRG